MPDQTFPCRPVPGIVAPKRIARWAAGALALSLSFSRVLPQSATPSVDFAKDIEPILVKRCSECHGPDKQKSGLRLDSREALLRAGESGNPAVVPGKSDQSELIRRVTTSDADDVMPPKGERLTVTEVAALRRWIDNGAVWTRWSPANHWSFRPLQKPQPPSVRTQGWVRSPLDAFVLAQLEAVGLQPNPPADPATLFRRLSLDLTGLPPHPDDVAEFLRDPSDAAYEKWVDRFLESRHYGEHLARWWLDLARYADSNGYQVDLARTSWPYRDWVINAFNQNLPFDRFTVEQLAGDLLPHATLAQKVATGFLRNSKINDEGGGDAEEYRTKAVKDRVHTVATTWLGLTMACAECHTHKYDPISQEEYYKFYAFFNNSTDGGNYSTDPSLPVAPPDRSKTLQHVRQRIDEVQRALATAETQLPAEQRLWEQAWQGAKDAWQPLRLTKMHSTGGSSYTNLTDGSVLATGVNPIYDTITFEAETALDGITAVLLEVLPDPSLPKNGPGRWGQTGNFILDEFAFWAVPNGMANTTSNLFFTRAAADWEQEFYRAEHAIDRNPKTGWAIAPEFGKPHFLVAELETPLRAPQGARLGFRFESYHGNSHTIGRWRVSVSRERSPWLLWPVAPEIRDLLRRPPEERSPSERTQLVTAFRTVSPTLRRLERELYRLNQREAELVRTKASALVMQERPGEPRETYVHVRGNFLEKGATVAPGVPAFLPPLPESGPAHRLALAQWLVRPDHPLPARVTVNRLWERFFGTALAKTSEDVGRMGEAPSHPELLDWLAAEFIRTGWNWKAWQKQVVLSATYRQDARTEARKLEQDYFNRLLSRGPRFRLDAETIRDQALAVSGLLNRQVGGPSVHPVQVANLWKEIGFLRPEIGMDEWPVSEGPDLYRRGVYTFWRRVCTFPIFATFDAPSRDVCLSRRSRSNTPLQALAALNEPTLLECARVLAQRIMDHDQSDLSARVQSAFFWCLGRLPTSAESGRLINLYQEQRASFQQDPASADQFIHVGSAPLHPRHDPAALAAWMVVANVLLNLDEMLTKG